MDFKPLLAFWHAVDLPQVIEPFNKIESDKLILSYFPYPHPHLIIDSFFKIHREYTHLILQPNDLIVTPEIFGRICEMGQKYDVCCGVANVDLGKYRNHFNVCWNLPKLGPYAQRTYRWLPESTADHMIELDIEYKLFFCGKVYKAQRIIDAGVTDIGFLRIVDDFNPADFPEPYPVGDMPKVGEDVFARGIHMHRESLQKDKVIHRITEMYYGIKETETVNGKLETKEFVYDNLPAKVLSEDALIAFMERPDINAESLEYMTKNHPTLMKTRDDHKISFGGLSGGPTVNARGEVVGVNVVEFGNEGDYIWDENGITYRPRVTLAILTSDNIKRALNGLNMDSR